MLQVGDRHLWVWFYPEKISLYFPVPDSLLLCGSGPGRWSYSFIHHYPFLCCGSGIFLTPRSGKGKKSGSGMNIPDHISECLETIFGGLKYFNSSMRIWDEKNPGSGMEKIRIRDARSTTLSLGRYLFEKTSSFPPLKPLNKRVGSISGSVILWYGSTDPYPNQSVTHPNTDNFWQVGSGTLDK